MLDRIEKISISFYSDIAIIRSLLAITTSLLVASNLDLPLPQLAPLFTLIFFGKNKDLTLKKAIAILIGVSILGSLGVFFSEYIIDYPMVLFSLFSLIIIFSFASIKINEPIRLVFLTLSIVLPFLGLRANFLGELSLTIILYHLTIAIASVQFFRLLFPLADASQDVISNSNSNINYEKIALNALIVLLPFLSFFFFFNVYLLPLTLIFTLLLSFDPLVNQSKKGFQLLISNIIGGIIGVVIYNILVIAPSFLLYAMLVFIVGSFFIIPIFYSKNNSLLYENAYKTFFVVMGTLSSSSDGASDVLFSRVFQVFLAIIYIIFAFKIVNYFNSPYEIKK